MSPVEKTYEVLLRYTPDITSLHVEVLFDLPLQNSRKSVQGNDVVCVRGNVREWGAVEYGKIRSFSTTTCSWQKGELFQVKMRWGALKWWQTQFVWKKYELKIIINKNYPFQKKDPRNSNKSLCGLYFYQKFQDPRKIIGNPYFSSIFNKRALEVFYFQ